MMTGDKIEEMKVGKYLFFNYLKAIQQILLVICPANVCAPPSFLVIASGLFRVDHMPPKRQEFIHNQ